MGTIKIAILEKDGEEYSFPVEMDLISALSFVGFSGGSGNFSYKRILSSQSILISTYQQMLLKGDITIEGDLNIEGELCLL